MALYGATDHRAHVSGAAAGTRPDSWSHLGPLGLVWGFAPSLFGVLLRVCCGLSPGLEVMGGDVYERLMEMHEMLNHRRGMDQNTVERLPKIIWSEAR